MRKGIAVNSNNENRHDDIDARRKRESGVALLFSMLLLFLLATLAFSSMDTVMRDAQIVGAKKSSERALQMAEAGVADALDFLYNTYDTHTNPPEVGQTVNMANYGGFGGSFDKQGHEVVEADYALVPGTAITMRGLGEPCMVSSDFKFSYGIWDIEVQGTSGDGLSTSAIHISVLKCQCVDINGCGDS